jgi:tetratricopeptide (TPR) repeat protein
MSRSIHTTRQQLAEARRRQYSDDAKRMEVINRLRRELRQKHWTKRQMRQEAAQARQPQVLAGVIDGTPVSAEAIPIEIEPEGDPRHVHHAASSDDLRALLAVLPPGMADGLSRVVLTLGKPDMERWARTDDAKPDPLTGRIGWEIFFGVYGGNFLGVYRPKSAGIWLYAYVYDPEKLPLPLPLCELFLRLRALTTFAHELAHHFDELRRVARGRWLARGKNRVERYAEEREYAWGQEFVAPLLRQRYPEQVRALEEWIAHHGGARAPLELLAGDPRTTRKDYLINLRSDVGAAFQSWLDDIAEQPGDLFASRFAFAQHLHWADQYDLCLEVLDGLLTGWPPTPKTWAYKADTLVHLERWDEAEVCARQALALDTKFLDAWTELGWVAIGRRNWLEVLANTDQRLTLIDAEEDRFEWREVMFHRAIAYCGLGKLVQMEECLTASVMREVYLKGRRKAVYRCAGVPLPTEPLQP